MGCQTLPIKAGVAGTPGVESPKNGRRGQMFQILGKDMVASDSSCLSGRSTGDGRIVADTETSSAVFFSRSHP